MTTVVELVPGDVVELAGDSAIFVQRARHPIWPHLELVIWKLANGDWSHDALDGRQHVGETQPATVEERDERLRRALLNSSAR